MSGEQGNIKDATLRRRGFFQLIKNALLDPKATNRDDLISERDIKYRLISNLSKSVGTPMKSVGLSSGKSPRHLRTMASERVRGLCEL